MCHERLQEGAASERSRNVKKGIAMIHRRSPNKSLQRSGTHKVLGRGRPSAESTRALRARVLRWRRAAAELGR
jgi:hypothetical protein